MPPLIRSKITLLFDCYVPPSIYFLRTHLRELAPSVDNNLTQSLMRILDCYFEPFYVVEGRAVAGDVAVSDMVTCIEALFLFSLVWSIGATTNEDGRRMFDGYLRTECHAMKTTFPFPKHGAFLQKHCHNYSHTCACVFYLVLSCISLKFRYGLRLSLRHDDEKVVEMDGYY